MGKKKGKGKGQEEKWEGEAEASSVLQGVKEGESPVVHGGGGGGKKGKKAKKTFDDDLGEDMEVADSGLQLDEGDTETPAAEGEGGGGTKGEGKKGKKGKKKKEDDWEDEVAKELEEMALAESTSDDKPEKLDKPFTEEVKAKEAGRANELPKEAGKGGKKGKKKKKNEEGDDEIDALAREIEGTGVGPPEKPTLQGDPPEQASSSPVQPLEAAEGTEGDQEVSTVMTAAQKKAAKKEREKKKKEAMKKAKQQPKVDDTQSAAVSKEPVEADKEPLAKDQGAEAKDQGAEVKGQGAELKGQSTDAKVPGSAIGEEKTEGAVGGSGGEEVEEGEDDKKKKKKKKKKAAEEEKKPKVKKPAKSAILKMKEQIEAVRLEQKKREEEELARLRAEEEAERLRLEQLQLEKERKEKRKQKEKERKQRRKEEGKPITKAEREKRARAQAHLEALKAQGITVPALSSEGGEKKKVLYGSRQRPKKPKPQAATGEAFSEVSATVSETPEETASETASSIQETEDLLDEGVKDNWDDEEEEENVKDNWDEESEEEKELSEPEPDKQAEPVKLVKPAKQDSVESVSDEEGESDSESSSSSESEESDSEDLTAYEKAEHRIHNRRKRHLEERSPDLLRSPVVCVLGHVDTGKTKILDKIRHTHVQDGEAGGITQQIGATFVPSDAIKEQTKMVKEFAKTVINLPGLLIIDTPGHESFSNLRTRGSSMCDLAILVVDVMHGLEPQTIESLNILRKGNTPFIVALNKIDRLFDWRRNPTSGVKETLKKQKVNTKDEFDERLKQVITEFAEQGLNVAVFWEKVDFREYIPIVPTSAITGDGMGDLIALLVNYSQKMLTEQLMLSQELEALVLEVKVIAGLGTTIDIILRDGMMKESDTLILTGSEGPFVTQIRALLMPQPLRELRVKNAYVNHKAIIASQGVKVCAKDLEKTLPGTPVFVARKQDEIEVLKDEAAVAMKSALSAIHLQERGVFVQASTLGSLEALLGFLKQSKIPYAGVNIGPVHKKDVMKASVMLEHDSQWAVILAFDVRVERDAQEMADSLGVKIFLADIIYHLFDNFLKHRQELHDRKRKEYENIAVFPCKVRILPNCIFNTRDPIVVGVIIESGIVKPGTPLTVPTKNFLDIGVVASLEMNHKPVDIARKGSEVCLKIAPTGGEAPRLYGRHFDHTDLLVSKINRDSIDAVKNYFREDMQKSDWQLMIELKKLFQII